MGSPAKNNAPATDKQQRQTAMSTVKLCFTPHYSRHSGCAATRCNQFLSAPPRNKEGNMIDSFCARRKMPHVLCGMKKKIKELHKENKHERGNP
jgi:hypothetical protein